MSSSAEKPPHPEYNPEVQDLLSRALCGDVAGLEQLDPEYLVNAAWYHGVAQLLDLQWHDHPDNGLTSSIRQRLAELSRMQAALDLLRNDATRKLLDLLAQADIPVLLLKGVPMSHLHYPKTWLRPCTDTDLYIPPDRVQDCAQVLGAHGYQHALHEVRIQSAKQFPVSIRPVQGVELYFDIHWRLSNRVLFRAILPFEACWEGRQRVAELGPNAHGLSDVDLTLHACVHRIAHGRNTMHNRLIWLYDVHLLAEALGKGGLEQLSTAALDKRIGAVCADAFATCARQFSTPLPAGFLEGLRSNQQAEPSATLINASRARWAWADLMALGTLRERWLFARELVVNKLPG